MSTTLSTNMSLPVPGVGNEAGPQWATDLNACLGILDAHDHSAGNGVQITPSGININADLPFNSSYSITTIKKVAFTSQVAALTGTSFLSTVGGNLYFNDSSGNQIPITSGGGVAGSPGSIGSLASPAAATYTAGSKLFTWTADSAKAAAMDNGAVTIRETNVASAKGVTIQSASSLAADYSLTLPAALPGSTQYVTSTNAGVLSFSSANTILAAVTTSAATPSNAIAAAVTRATGTSVGQGGVAISTSSGTFALTSASYTDVTNLSVTIVTSGRPVRVQLMPAGGSLSSQILCVGTVGDIFMKFKLLRDAVDIGQLLFDSQQANNNSDTKIYSIIPGSISTIDDVTGGTYVYKLQAAAGSGQTLSVTQCKLVAYEL